jgi:ribosomal protein S19E (S16A)
LATVREVQYQKFPHNNISKTIKELEREGLFKIPQNGRYINQKGARLE